MGASARESQRQDGRLDGRTAGRQTVIGGDGRRQITGRHRQTAGRQTADGRFLKRQDGRFLADGMADGRRQTADGRRRRQTADGRRQTADGRRQTADGRRQTADGRRQTADGRRQTQKKTAQGGQFSFSISHSQSRAGYPTILCGADNQTARRADILSLALFWFVLFGFFNDKFVQFKGLYIYVFRDPLYKIISWSCTRPARFVYLFTFKPSAICGTVTKPCIVVYPRATCIFYVIL